MTTRPGRWGYLLLVIALLLVIGIGLFAVVLGPQPEPWILEILLPTLGLLVGVIVLFAGHFSYPRVQNLKVYLAGYSAGLQSIMIALLLGFTPYFTSAIPDSPAGFGELVLALALGGALCYALIPPFPTYRTTRIVTLALISVQLLILVAVRFFPATFWFDNGLRGEHLLSPVHIVVAAVTVSIVVVNVALAPQSFYLRGAFSGLGVLAGGVWLLPSVLEAMGYGHVNEKLILLTYAAVAPIFLAISIFSHVLARMEHRVAYDGLLQIYNRQYANQIIAEQSSVSTRPPLAVFMIDIDHFKLVNDTYGHQAGDRVLYAVAQTVQKTVVPEGIVCRYGGEELIVFFPCRTGRDVVPLAQRLRLAIEKLETGYKRHRISVTASIGLSDRSTTSQTVANVVYAADKALYIAKENGRNQVRFVRIKQNDRPNSMAPKLHLNKPPSLRLGRLAASRDGSTT